MRTSLVRSEVITSEDGEHLRADLEDDLQCQTGRQTKRRSGAEGVGQKCISRPDTVPHRFYLEVVEVPKPTPPPYSVEWYRVGYQSCSSDPNQVYSEAGTEDPQEAAEWYADQGAAGDPSGTAGLFQGCYDALTGEVALH